MKVKSFDIDQVVFSDFFRPIRDKIDVVKCLLSTMKYVSYYKYIDVSDAKGIITLCINKMNRINYLSDGKYFSICSPFSMVIVDDEVRFYSSSNGEVDSQIISQLLSVLNDVDSINTECIGKFADKVMDETAKRPLFWNILRELLMMEDGYIRYDYDPEPSRCHATLHPLNHLDVCYSNNATFKVGLSDKITHHEFNDILDVTTECYFLSKT